MQQVYNQEEIDKILDQYLAGKLSAEEVRLLHSKLQNKDVGNIDEDDLEHIILPHEILHPTTQAEKMAEKIIYAPAGRNFEWTENRYEKYQWANGRYAAIVAVFLGLLLLLPFTHVLLSLNKEQGVVAKYFSPHDQMPLQRAITNTQVQNIWHAAILKYRSGNYAAAAASINQLFVFQLPDVYIDHLYMGICYIGDSQPREALYHLEAAAKIAPDSDFANLNNWYMALAHIQNGNSNAAMPLLKALSVTPTFVYHNRAIELLDEL